MRKNKTKQKKETKQDKLWGRLEDLNDGNWLKFVNYQIGMEYLFDMLRESVGSADEKQLSEAIKYADKLLAKQGR